MSNSSLLNAAFGAHQIFLDKMPLVALGLFTAGVAGFYNLVCSRLLAHGPDDPIPQPIDLLVSAARELRNGLVRPASPLPIVVSLRCCARGSGVLVVYQDGQTQIMRPLVAVSGSAAAHEATRMDADIRGTENRLHAEQAGEENPAELPLTGDSELSLKLMDRALAWLRCDVVGDIESMPALMSEDAEMFGAR